jgi:hypothetical protein
MEGDEDGGVGEEEDEWMILTTLNTLALGKSLKNL